ncbi:hypothetical protein [Candidatus Midichloria mitochondrii]|uniref:hypothetical protein n=1 Tax=Candidatus Midichloria mitochondrii TaxID=234827 RepID=UPI001F255892|nr:hypothetical protein [Candidatus Midichloria mitochondrii]
MTLEEYTNKILRIGSILDHDYEVQTVNAIINHDIETLNTVITKHGPRCDALPIVNFNLLQLGAISGDSKIFKRLLDYCSKDLLNEEHSN